MSASDELGALIVAPGWARGTAVPLEADASLVLRSGEERMVDRLLWEERPDLFSVSESRLVLPASIGREWRRDLQKAQDDFWRGRDGYGAFCTEAEDAEWRHITRTARRGALDKLRDWLAGRSVSVEESRLVKVQVPLFVLAAADVPGCSAVYEREVQFAEQGGWSVAIAGTGFGHDGNVTVSLSETFGAAAGERKLVFVPVQVAVERVTVSVRDQPAASAYQVDVQSVKGQRPAPGCLLLEESADLRPGRDLDTYPLAGDTPGAEETYGRSYEQTSERTLKLGVKLHEVDISLDSKVSLGSKIELRFTLIGGRNYRLRELQDADGVMWA